MDAQHPSVDSRRVFSPFPRHNSYLNTRSNSTKIQRLKHKPQNSMRKFNHPKPLKKIAMTSHFNAMKSQPFAQTTKNSEKKMMRGGHEPKSSSKLTNRNFSWNENPKILNLFQKHKSLEIGNSGNNMFQSLNSKRARKKTKKTRHNSFFKGSVNSDNYRGQSKCRNQRGFFRNVNNNNNKTFKNQNLKGTGDKINNMGTNLEMKGGQTKNLKRLYLNNRRQHSEDNSGSDRFNSDLSDVKGGVQSKKRSRPTSGQRRLQNLDRYIRSESMKESYKLASKTKLQNQNLGANNLDGVQNSDTIFGSVNRGKKLELSNNLKNKENFLKAGLNSESSEIKDFEREYTNLENRDSTQNRVIRGVWAEENSHKAKKWIGTDSQGKGSGKIKKVLFKDHQNGCYRLPKFEASTRTDHIKQNGQEDMRDNSLNSRNNRKRNPDRSNSQNLAHQNNSENETQNPAKSKKNRNIRNNEHVAGTVSNTQNFQIGESQRETNGKNQKGKRGHGKLPRFKLQKNLFTLQNISNLNHLNQNMSSSRREHGSNQKGSSMKPKYMFQRRNYSLQQDNVRTHEKRDPKARNGLLNMGSSSKPKFETEGANVDQAHKGFTSQEVRISNVS